MLKDIGGGSSSDGGEPEGRDEEKETPISAVRWALVAGSIVILLAVIAADDNRRRRRKRRREEAQQPPVFYASQRTAGEEEEEQAAEGRHDAHQQPVVSGTSEMPAAEAGSAAGDNGDSEGPKLHADPRPVLGTATAIYPFEGVGDGKISLDLAEEVWLLERDAGDGWLLVRRWSGPEEGFAPISYLNCHWNSDE